MFNKQDFINAHGKEVEGKVIAHILKNFYFCNHAITRLEERTNLIVRDKNGAFNKYLTKINIVNDIVRNKVLAYYNTDGSVNIAIDEYNYYVFEYQEDRDKWLLHTFKEPSWNKITIFQKQELAIRGISRN